MYLVFSIKKNKKENFLKVMKTNINVHFLIKQKSISLLMEQLTKILVDDVEYVYDQHRPTLKMRQDQKQLVPENTVKAFFLQIIE